MGNYKEDEILVAFIIVGKGIGNQVIKQGINLGLNGGLISSADGLNDSLFFNLFFNKRHQRDFILFYQRASVLELALQQLIEDFDLNEQNRGVIFILKTKFKLKNDYRLNNNDWNDTEVDHQLILMALKHGRAIEIVDRITHVSSAGATIFSGKNAGQLEKNSMLGFNVMPHKDIVLSIVRSDQVPDVFMVLDNQYQYTKTKHFFVFSFEINRFSQEQTSYLPVQHRPYQMLIAIVSEELEKDYIKIMKQCKINGGSSIKGYGSVSPEMVERLFNVTINPEKKILLSVDKYEKINQFYRGIYRDERMNEKHKGIYFTLPIYQAYGLFESDQKIENNPD